MVTDREGLFTEIALVIITTIINMTNGDHWRTTLLYILICFLVLVCRGLCGGGGEFVYESAYVCGFAFLQE